MSGEQWHVPGAGGQGGLLQPTPTRANHQVHHHTWWCAWMWHAVCPYVVQGVACCGMMCGVVCTPLKNAAMRGLHAGASATEEAG